MVRLRLPGGRVSAAALRRLGELAAAYGNGILQLTSRAGVQLRGLPDLLPAPFVDAVVAAGVLPTVSHERVRNIVASPLTGLSGGRADVGPLISGPGRRAGGRSLRWPSCRAGSCSCSTTAAATWST